jgi:hypothetical protein
LAWIDSRSTRPEKEVDNLLVDIGKKVPVSERVKYWEGKLKNSDLIARGAADQATSSNTADAIDGLITNLGKIILNNVIKKCVKLRVTLFESSTEGCFVKELIDNSVGKVRRDSENKDLEYIVVAVNNLARIIACSVLIQKLRKHYLEAKAVDRKGYQDAVKMLIDKKYELTQERDRAKPTLPLYKKVITGKSFIVKNKRQKEFTDEAIVALRLDRLTSRPESVGYDVGVSATWPDAHSDSSFPFALRAINFRFKSDPAVTNVVNNRLTVNKETITLELANQVVRASAKDENGKSLSEITPTTEDKKDKDTIQYLYVPNGTYLAGTADEFTIAGISEATRHAIQIQS